MMKFNTPEIEYTIDPENLEKIYFKTKDSFGSLEITGKNRLNIHIEYIMEEDENPSMSCYIKAKRAEEFADYICKLL